MQTDIFRPNTEPARSIYDAFQKEASMRSSRSLNDWITTERVAVYNEALKQAHKLKVKPLTMDDIEKAELYALGSSDYGASWAYKIAQMLFSM
jgi:hypothetical protein